MDGITITTVPARTVAGVRQRVRMDELKDTFDQGFHEVAAAIDASPAAIAGPSYARYRGMPSDVVDVEMGFPVDQPFSPSGAVLVENVPEVEAVEVYHLGDYDSLGKTYERIGEWIAERELNTADDMWEIYESGPDDNQDPVTYRTRILFPLTR